jgi:hypothetical protein
LIPLKRLLRQGEPSREVAAEFDLLETEDEQNVGTVSMLITNEGRRVNKNEMPTRN